METESLQKKRLNELVKILNGLHSFCKIIKFKDPKATILGIYYEGREAYKEKVVFENTLIDLLHKNSLDEKDFLSVLKKHFDMFDIKIISEFKSYNEQGDIEAFIPFINEHLSRKDLSYAGKTIIALILSIKELKNKKKLFRIENLKDFEGVKKYYSELKKEIKNGDETAYEVPKEIKIYSGLEITKKDKYCFRPPSKLLKETVMVSNNNDEFCGFFTAEEDKTKAGTYYLTSKDGDIKTQLLKNCGEMYLHIIFDDENNERIEKVGVSVSIEGVVESDSELCIDFGTSNTTAGTYNEDGPIEIVEFENKYENSYSKLFPTVVYVKDCSDSKKVEYIFGFDAKAEEWKLNYCLKGSIFYEIKRWVSDYDNEEELRDDSGNKVSVKRLEIIKAYLHHVLSISEHHFKKRFKSLHLSAPVKMKTRYIEMFKKIFPKESYSLPGEDNTLDEGFSIIYNFIRGEIEDTEKKTSDTKDSCRDSCGKKSVMIMDSGGGTTDLASSEYSFKKEPDGWHLDIDTEFEDCNSNFGGNNLTHRIMQLLKLKLVVHYKKCDVKCDVSEIIGDEKSIKRMVDDKKYSAIYAEFEREHEKAEEYIPTRFLNLEKFHSRNDNLKVKSNFYLLWNIAETIKKEFFKRDNFVMINFSKTSKESDSVIKLPNFERLNLNIHENGKFQEIEELPDLSINFREVERLIYGDIYYLIFGLLAKREKALQDFNYFKFSGQTCRISLFEDLFKEFVPGRKFRDKKVVYSEDDPAALKIQCVEGCIKYCMDKSYGKIVPNISNRHSRLQFKIVSLRNEKLMLEEQKFEIEEFDLKTASRIKLIINDDKDNEVNTIVYKFNPDKKGEKKDLCEIFKNKDSKKYEEVLNNASANKRIIAVVPFPDRGGFTVYEIVKKLGDFWVVNKEPYNFEKDLQEISFFNGTK
jgi:hypothetical protein